MEEEVLKKGAVKSMSKEYMNTYEEIKSKKPIRLGELVGGEENSFYIAKSENEVYELSPLAYYVWMVCDGDHTVEELIKTASEEIDVDESDIIEPFIIALTSLLKVELVKYVDQ